MIFRHFRDRKWCIVFADFSALDFNGLHRLTLLKTGGFIAVHRPICLKRSPKWVATQNGKLDREFCSAKITVIFTSLAYWSPRSK